MEQQGKRLGLLSRAPREFTLTIAVEDVVLYKKKLTRVDAQQILDFANGIAATMVVPAESTPLRVTLSDVRATQEAVINLK